MRCRGRAGRDGGARGAELARRVAARFESTDVFEIAARAGVKIAYERWPLVTVGECEPRAATIRVNLAALEGAPPGDAWFCATALARVIIAHELGHLFDERFNRSARQRSGGAPGEVVAHSFAARLLRLPFGFEEYERYWRSL